MSASLSLFRRRIDRSSMSSGVKRRGRGRGGAREAGDRALRQKVEKQYVDGMESDSDEEGNRQTFSVMEKLQDNVKFPKYFIKELKGEEVNLEYFQR